jgi:hypothetical protein
VRLAIRTEPAVTFFLSLKPVAIDPEKPNENKRKKEIDNLFNDDYFKEKLTKFIKQME